MRWACVYFDAIVDGAPTRLPSGIWESNDGEWQLWRTDEDPAWREWTLMRRADDGVFDEYRESDETGSWSCVWHTLREAKRGAPDVIGEALRHE